MSTSVRVLLLQLGVCAVLCAQEPGPETPDSASASSVVAVAPADPQPQPDVHVSRMRVFGKRLVGFQAFIETIPGTAFDEARNFPGEWGRGISGIGRRFASQYGQFLLSETMALGIGAVHHEVPEFHRRGTGTIGSRVKRVLLSSVLADTTSGGRTIAASQLAGVYGAWGIATLWNPPSHRNIRSVAGYGTLGLGLKVGGNGFAEFWPDAKRLLKRKK